MGIVPEMAISGRWMESASSTRSGLHILYQTDCNAIIIICVFHFLYLNFLVQIDPNPQTNHSSGIYACHRSYLVRMFWQA